MKTITIAIQDALAERFGMNEGKGFSRTINANLSDADSGIAFMVSQVAYLEQQMYAVPYANIVFESLVPMVTDVPEGIQAINYRSYDGATMGKFLGARADDLPLVSAEGKLNTVPVSYGGIGVKYSLDELRTAALTGFNLDTQQSNLAYRGAREHQQKVVFFGDAERGMTGLFNHPNVTVSNGTVDWDGASTTPEQIIGEINAFISEVWTASKQYFLPNTVLMTGKRFTLLNSLKMNAASNISALNYLRQNNIYTEITGLPLDIRPLPYLEAAELAKMGVSNSNKDRMVIYDRNITNVKAWMPIAPRFVAPQYLGLNIQVPMEYKISGTEFIYPTSAMYVDLV